MTTMHLRRGAFALATILALLPLSACSDDDPTEPEGPGTVVLQFDHAVGSASLAMNSGTYTNAAGNTYSVSKLEYLVSDFVLTGPAGTFTAETPHYRDASDGSTRTLTLSEVPAGTYTTLAFVHGMDDAMNQDGAFPDLDALGMGWPDMLGGGYHYMRHEGSFTTETGEPGNFTTHTGPSRGNDFSIPFQLTLPSSVDVKAGETVTIRLVMDVNEWYTNPETYDFDDFGLIMGNTEVQGMLRSNGADVWSVGSVN